MRSRPRAAHAAAAPPGAKRPRSAPSRGRCPAGCRYSAPPPWPLRRAGRPRSRAGREPGTQSRQMTRTSPAVYLYVLVRSDRRPSLAGAPAGLPGTGPLRIIEAGPRLWLVAADAPLARYGEEPIARGLKDLDWVAER